MTKSQVAVHSEAMIFNFKIVDKKLCEYFIYIYISDSYILNEQYHWHKAICIIVRGKP